MTIPELKEKLDAYGVEYPSTANKADLEALWETAQPPKGRPANKLVAKMMEKALPSNCKYKVIHGRVHVEVVEDSRTYLVDDKLVVNSPKAYENFLSQFNS